MKLDIGITQGTYWKGGQIPYWLYMVFVILPFTGLFGVDHLLLRSPLTAILKFLSIIPLFGFWYFYDIAQLGEKELIQKNGIGVPFYGPIGLGAGIFTGTGPESPPDVARPWRFVAYTMASMLFIAFPINKLVLGDYWAALAQTVMYILFPLTFIAIGWGFYDTFRILFDTRNLFETGASRLLPASLILDPEFNRSALGPLPAIPHDPSKDGWLRRLFSAAIEVPIVGLKATSGIINIADSATVGIVGEAAHTAKDVITETGSAVESAIQSSAGVVSGAASAAEKVTSLVGKLPDITEKITSELSDPSLLMAHAKPGLKQLGGALINNSPSTSSTVLIFSVALLAFSGYVMYTLRKTIKSKSEDNDSPPDPATVRRLSKAPYTRG
jgi:hypothetical protein